jgi:catechol 2,3-dioxygenase-like lactoylglutathione lyase family enzyme
VKKLIAIMSLFLWLPVTASWAQLSAPNESGVSLGQWYTIVKDVDAAKKFWIILGGSPIKVDGLDVVKFPGVLIFLKQGTPSGGSVGSPVNHVGFEVQNVMESVDKWLAAGVTIGWVGTSPLNGQRTAHFDTPDGLELEIVQAGAYPYPSLAPNHAMESNHIHFSAPTVPESSRKDMQGWYVKTLSATPRTLGQELTGDIPGVKFMRFGFPSKTLAPTKGRAIDHIGFEVKNLQEFCKKLEASGVTFDAPYSKSRHKSFASAELTDPWGVSIELTEGLSRF